MDRGGSGPDAAPTGHDQGAGQQLRRFAARWPTAVWAIEGAGGLGAPLASRLTDAGIAAVDVPAKLATRVRMLSTGHGRKNDDADALSVGIAAHSARGLRSAVVETPSSRCAPWSNTATTWSTPEPRQSTGCMCC